MSGAYIQHICLTFWCNECQMLSWIRFTIKSNINGSWISTVFDMGHHKNETWPTINFNLAIRRERIGLCQILVYFVFLVKFYCFFLTSVRDVKFLYFQADVIIIIHCYRLRLWVGYFTYFRIISVFFIGCSLIQLME